MRILGGCDSAPVEIARLVQTAQLFERLAAVKVRSRIPRVGCEKGFELAEGALEFPGFDELHGEAVADERIGRVLPEQLLQGFDARRIQFSVRIPLVACPFFLPVERVNEPRWIHAPRLPLGDRYRGLCRARSGESFEAQGDACNCGYARGVCDRFPEETQADAVRFSIRAGDPLKLIYIVERSHAPVEHGLVGDRDANEILTAQARAFAESHARERGLTTA